MLCQKSISLTSNYYLHFRAYSLLVLLSIVLSSHPFVFAENISSTHSRRTYTNMSQQASFCWRHQGRNMARAFNCYHRRRQCKNNSSMYGYKGSCRNAVTAVSPISMDSDGLGGLGGPGRCRVQPETSTKRAVGDTDINANTGTKFCRRRRCRSNPEGRPSQHHLHHHRRHRGSADDFVDHRPRAMRSLSEPAMQVLSSADSPPCRHSNSRRTGQPFESADDSPAEDLQGSSHRAVMDYLFDHVHEITRETQDIRQEVGDDSKVIGVQALTTSQNPQVARAIQRHVAQMQAIQHGNDGVVVRRWDPLFRAASQYHREGAIRLDVEPTEGGVRAQTIGTTPCGVALARAHAQVVTQFVEQGWNERPKEHPVPQECKNLHNSHE